MRHPFDISCLTKIGFNPRICKRCDIRFSTVDLLTEVSIHASVKDATSFVFISIYHFIVSIHASVKDATGRTMEMYNQISVSIHASVKDATSHGVRVCRILPVSIHASVKDATGNYQKSQLPKRFQSTHL